MRGEPGDILIMEEIIVNAILSTLNDIVNTQLSQPEQSGVSSVMLSVATIGDLLAS